jgi:hypothetical protein
MEPVTGDVTSGAGMEPVTGDVTSGAVFRNVQIGVFGKSTMVSFVSTVGPFCLVQPGASLARFAEMQAQLLH